MKISDNKGFTLMEVAVATAILAISLSTLLALETNYVNNYIEEKSRTRAAFYARYIMTMLEVESQKEPPSIGTDSGSLRAKLKEMDYFSYKPDSKVMDEEEYLGDYWKYELDVTSLTIPISADVSADDVLRKAELSVAWGEGVGQKFLLEYYFYKPPR